MKILIVSNMYPSVQNPGYGVFVKNFERSLRDLGVNVVRSVIVGRANSKFSKFFAYVSFFLRTSYLVLFGRYDCIYVHYVAHSLLPLVPLAPFLRLRGVKVVCNAHGEDLLPRTATEILIYKFVYGFISRSSLLVVPSPYFADLARSKFPNLDVFVSASGGIDLDLFKPSDSLGAGGAVLHIGYVSRVDSGKGWDVLLKAVKILRCNHPDITMVVSFVGEGREVNALCEQINLLSLQDISSYLGAVPQVALPEFYASIDVFVFPTQLPESLGLVGLEAMACGVPAICSDIGGIRGYLRDGINGYLFKSGDAEELAGCIVKFSKLLDDDKIRLRRSAVESASKYDKRLVAKQLYSKLVDVMGN